MSRCPSPRPSRHAPLAAAAESEIVVKLSLLSRTHVQPTAPRAAPTHLSIAALVVAFALSGCAKNPVRPVTVPVRWGTGTIDFALAWSRDGQWIAFRRQAPSSYGPPGMYVVNRTGTIVRYVYGPADLFFPREASFSPDGRFIAAVDFGRQLIIVDIATLEVRHPLYTQSAVWHPDWSPDGRSILYSQFYAGNPATTLDSLGLFLFDVATGTTRPLRWGPDPVYSFYPRWSPDGRLIAMDELVAPSKALSVMNADGTGHRFLIPARSLQLYRDIDWYRPAPGQAARILFWKTQQPGAGPYLINADGTEMTPFWHRIQSEGFLSPSGVEYVRGSPDPTSHYWVLYVGLIADVTDVALRQITSYDPPIPTGPVRAGEAQHEAKREESFSIEQQPPP
jgi:WD40 repeat protein